MRSKFGRGSVHELQEDRSLEDGQVCEQILLDARQATSARRDSCQETASVCYHNDGSSEALTGKSLWR